MMRSRYRGHWRSHSVNLSEDKFTSTPSLNVNTKNGVGLNDTGMGRPNLI
jgi:hypothetical protein